MYPVPMVGNVWSMMNVAPVELPARSVTRNICVPSLEIPVHDVYGKLSNVAPARFVSLNVIATLPE